MRFWSARPGLAWQGLKRPAQQRQLAGALYQDLLAADVSGATPFASLATLWKAQLSLDGVSVTS
ncbi:hypothetical protein, partial [Chromobacterium phragmitis]|uniref:hypothetical protein n=1 Tax=Chromobacterium phragmitis TaxID=2202141 RepID=UPI0032659E92